MSSDSCGDGLTGLGHRLDYTMKGATGTGDGSDRPQKESSGSALCSVCLGVIYRVVCVRIMCAYRY